MLAGIKKNLSTSPCRRELNLDVEIALFCMLDPVDFYVAESVDYFFLHVVAAKFECCNCNYLLAGNVLGTNKLVQWNILKMKRCVKHLPMCEFFPTCS